MTDPATTSMSAMLLTSAYPIRQHRLSNGLRIVVSPDHTAPIAAVNLGYDVGSRHERPGLTGFAHLFEHLMFQGSANVGPGEHLQLLQQAGADLNATTGFDRTTYFETLPKGGLELALWLEADRMAGLAVTEEGFGTQRSVIKEEKRQRYDNVPYGNTTERLLALLFEPTHPYAHPVIGSMTDLDAASLSEVQEFHARYYVPANAVLTIVGSVDPEHAFALAEAHFGPLPHTAPPSPLWTPAEPALTGVPRDEAVSGGPADAVHFGYRLPQRGSEEFDAADLVSTILGQGRGSRLHRRLVRGDEIAESAGASTLGLIGGTSLGFVHARCRDQVSPAHIEDIMIAEIEDLIAEGPTDAEVERAKAAFARRWLQELSRMDSRADQITGFALGESDPALVNSRIQVIEAIENGQIAAAAAHFHPDRRAVLTYRQEQP